jgi:hypothetical protein
MVSSRTDKLRRPINWALRLSLVAGLLSAVADRFGLWGGLGTTNVAWGTMQNFIRYTGVLCPWCPSSLLPSLAWFVTAAELTLGIGLIVGFELRIVAFATSVLTAMFALAMALTLGVHAPLNYSVFTFSAAALCLAAREPERS